MKLGRAVMALAAIGLGGCVDLDAQAVREVQDVCKSQGKQFIIAEIKHHGIVPFGNTSVTGHCVGPGEPGYVPAKPPSSKTI